MDFKLPKLGEGADSGVVVNIFVKEGDTIAKDQNVLELRVDSHSRSFRPMPTSSGLGGIREGSVSPGAKLLSRPPSQGEHPLLGPKGP